MSERLLFLVCAAAWLLLSVQLADLVQVGASAPASRWHALVPYVGLLAVCVAFRPRRRTR